MPKKTCDQPKKKELIRVLNIYAADGTYVTYNPALHDIKQTIIKSKNSVAVYNSRCRRKAKLAAAAKVELTDRKFLDQELKVVQFLIQQRPHVVAPKAIAAVPGNPKPAVINKNSFHMSEVSAFKKPQKFGLFTPARGQQQSTMTKPVQSITSKFK